MIHGVLTNPNCEYHANFVAISTMTQWCKGLSIAPDVTTSSDNNHMTMEDNASNQSTVEVDEMMDMHVVKAVLEPTLREWLKDFSQPVQRIDLRTGNIVKSTKLVVSDRLTGDLDNMCGGHSETEPMDKGHVSPDSDSGDSINSRESNHDKDKQEMSMEQSPLNVASEDSETASKLADGFTYEDLKLLVDLFHLPHQHGEQARRLLEDFDWLKHHAPGHRALDIHRRRQEESTETTNKGEASATSEGDNHDSQKVTRRTEI